MATTARSTVATPIDVCDGTNWVAQAVDVDTPVVVTKWVQAGGWEYDVIGLNGQQVLTRTKLKSSTT